MTEGDLSRLSPSELLDLALLAEEEAARRYGELSAQMESRQNARAAALFRDIQAHEREHVRRLQEQRARCTAKPTSLENRRSSDPREAPPDEALAQRIEASDVFQLAFRGEEHACSFYQKLTEILVDPEAKDLARSLWTEELGHLEWVARELRNLPPIVSERAEAQAGEHPAGGDGPEGATIEK